MAIAKRISKALLVLLMIFGGFLWLLALLLFSQVAEDSDDFAQAPCFGSAPFAIHASTGRESGSRNGPAGRSSPLPEPRSSRTAISKSRASA